MKLGPGVEFEADEAVTQTFGILAKRGAGKSNAAAVMAEELHAAGHQFVVVDPVGAWWGLRSSADGKRGGLPIVILGGYRGDVPLEASGAELVADLVVDERLSCVLDVSAFESEGAKKRFLAAFAERLFRQKGRPGKDDPLHLFLEEADDYAPQRAMGVETNRCLGAFQRIVKQGRARGLGSTMVTQRSAAINKDLLTQVETLIVLRTTSPTDRKAIEGWVKYHDVDGEVLASLSALATGEAWVWSPSWLELTQRTQIRRRRTFDSGATPSGKSGKRKAPATLADVDLASLEQRMVATIERAKAEDPRELRHRIVELERQVQELERRAPAPKEIRVEVPLEVPRLTPEQFERLEKLHERVYISWSEHEEREYHQRQELLGALVKLTSPIWDEEAIELALERLQQLTATSAGERTERALPAEAGRGVVAPSTPAAADRTPVVRPSQGTGAAPTASTSDPAGDPVRSGAVSKPQQRILDALAWFAAVGVEQPKRAALGAVAGVSSRSSGFEKNLSTLRTAGLVDYPAGGRVTLTNAGRTAAKLSAYPLTEADLQDAICRMVSDPQARILRALIATYPAALSREELASRVEVSPASSGFEKNLSTLRTWELVDYPERGSVVALPILFLREAA